MNAPVQSVRDPAEDRLVLRAKEGDTAAFDELVTLHRNKVFAIVYNVIRSEEDAWDLSQEAFVRAWKNLKHFQERSSFFTWLYRIAINVTRDWLRRKKIEGATEFDDAIDLHTIEPGATTAPRSVPSPPRQLEHAEIARRIGEAFELLSPEHRLVMTLRELEGQSYEEIAEATGASLGTVMSRLFYARKRLQALLGDVYQSLR